VNGLLLGVRRFIYREQSSRLSRAGLTRYCQQPLGRWEGQKNSLGGEEGGGRSKVDRQRQTGRFGHLFCVFFCLVTTNLSRLGWGCAAPVFPSLFDGRTRALAIGELPTSRLSDLRPNDESGTESVHLKLNIVCLINGLEFMESWSWQIRVYIGIPVLSISYR
jgi:hypothetical protein